MKTIHHALVLNLHQPAGNLEHLLTEAPWEAKEILWSSKVFTTPDLRRLSTHRPLISKEKFFRLAPNPERIR